MKTRRGGRFWYSSSSSSSYSSSSLPPFLFSNASFVNASPGALGRDSTKLAVYARNFLREANEGVITRISFKLKHQKTKMKNMKWQKSGLHPGLLSSIVLQCRFFGPLSPSSPSLFSTPVPVKGGTKICFR